MNNKQVSLSLYTNHPINMQNILSTALKITTPGEFDYVTRSNAASLLITRMSMRLLNTAKESAISAINIVASGARNNAPMLKQYSWLGVMGDWLFSKMLETMDTYYTWGRYGSWTAPLIDSSTMFSMYGIRSSIPLQPADTNNIEWEQQRASTAALHQMKHIAAPKLTSLREKNILRWTKGGKTADRIAMALSLRLSTVNFHLRSAMMKLDTFNKTAAAVCAIFYRRRH